MKGLAVCSLLFSVLAVVLVYVATQGLGMRSSSYLPSHVSSFDSKPQRIVEPTPVVEVERSQPSTTFSGIPKPEVSVSRVSRRRRQVMRQPQAPKQQLAVLVKPAPAAAVKPKASKPKPTVRAKPLEQPRVEPAKPAEPEIHPRDVSDSGPLTERDEEWKRRTLERWHRELEAAESRDGSSRSSSTASPRTVQEPELRDTPVEGMYPADGEKKSEKKSKRKRHRFLIFHWN